MAGYPQVSASAFFTDHTVSDSSAFSSALISSRMFTADEQLSTNPAIFYNPTHGVGSCSSSEVSSLRFSSTSGHLNHHRYEMTTDCLFDPTWMPTAADALMYQNFSHHQSLPTNPAAASLFDSMSMKSLIPAYSTTVSLPYGTTESKPARSSIPTNHTSSSALKMFRCVTCGKEYCRKSTLKAHMKHHIGDRPFSCQVCGKTFSQAANLTAHKRVHTGEKPFSCSICLRPFSQSSSLVTHKRTHTGERPYPCQMCDKAFTDSSTLTKHLRTHTGQKPYSCPLCMMRFSQSGNLHRHMKTHRTSQRA
uniref:C2H2-type domain-containing protein n=1 Tax=Acrobeloides nanus TaxID=290746 RepID=A0A914BZZ2_9BILA